MPTAQVQHTRRLIRLPEVLTRVGLRRSRWYDLVAEGRAPTPVRLSERAVAWSETEVDDWIRERIAERDAGAAGLVLEEEGGHAT